MQFVLVILKLSSKFWLSHIPIHILYRRNYFLPCIIDNQQLKFKNFFFLPRFLVEFGCDVNAQDSDGWTPLHCAASCNNLTMVKFLVESGACLFAATLSDSETPAEKCEEDEEGFDGCSEYLYSKLFSLFSS